MLPVARGVVHNVSQECSLMKRSGKHFVATTRKDFVGSSVDSKVYYSNGSLARQSIPKVYYSNGSLTRQSIPKVYYSKGSFARQSIPRCNIQTARELISPFQGI